MMKKWFSIAGTAVVALPVFGHGAKLVCSETGKALTICSCNAKMARSCVRKGYIVMFVGLMVVAGRSASTQTDQASVDRVIANWKQTPKQAAQAMLQKYGPPKEIADQRLIWLNNGSWKRSELVNEEIPHSFPMDHKDVLEQVIEYKVPPDKFDELAQYDGSVIVERTKGELSARCDKEEMNFPALNLAHDIVTGKRDVEDTRQFYAKTAMAFKKGQKSEYTQGLQFLAPTAGAADPDQPVTPKEGAEDASRQDPPPQSQ